MSSWAGSGPSPPPSINSSETMMNGTAAKKATATDHHQDEEDDEEVVWLESVEWGPRPDEDGYDTDQELAPRPKGQSADPCHCRRRAVGNNNEEKCCLDSSCLNYACQEECRSNCPTGEHCGNRRIQQKQFKQLNVFDTNSPKGKGLKAMEDIKKGEFCAEYYGCAVKESKLQSLFRRYQMTRRLYIMALGDGVYLDARKKGGVARYINHSCEPNCRVERWKVRGILRAVVVAIQDIAAGEELTFDYKWERKRGRAPTKCYCGTPSCRGTLEVSKSLEETDLEKELQGHWEKMITKPDQTIVNRTIQVFSKEHEEYFLGEVTGYNAEKGQHCILYRHDMNEVWEDLNKEDWMILNAKVDKEHFIIAKKVGRRRPSPTSSLLASNIRGQQQNIHAKHYIYVQTPVKEAFWAKHLIERCERNCGVQIQAQQFAKPPLPCNRDDPEEVEKYEALDQSNDGTVWKLTITGSDVAKAHSILEKNVAYLEKKLESEAMAAATVDNNNASMLAATANGSSLHLNATQQQQHEVILPRQIVDTLKRKLPLLREKCRSVNLTFAPSESKTKQFSRLVIEGTLLSDIESAKEQLWGALVALCVEANAPMAPNKIHRNLGFFGGSLSAEQFQLLCNGGGSSDRRLEVDAQEDLSSSPFFASFESTNRCTIWVQSEEDKGRINSGNQIVNESSPDSPRKVFFGCQPKEILRLWTMVQARAAELARGVKYLYLGLDRVYQPLMMKNGGQFFEYIHRVTGATVTVDSMTGDHLRIDGRAQTSNGGSQLMMSQVEERSEAERAGLAEELIRLQIELFRDHCIREQSWLFGRDWTLVASSSISTSEPANKSSSFGQLDRKAVAQGGTEVAEIAEIVANLGLTENVAAHAATILYRFVSTRNSVDTQIKVREAVLACIFLANKSQKLNKWKRLEVVLQAGYETFYPGTEFDKSNEQVLVLEERVISAEKEILQTLEYDIFWSDIEWILSAARGAGKMGPELIQSVKEIAFSGPVLGAGAELWLKYGVEYIFAVAAGFLKAKLEDLLPALSLIPLKVSQAAELLVDSAKLGRPSGKKAKLHPLLEGGKERLMKYLPRIKEACVESMKKGLVNGSAVKNALGSSEDQRYRIISERSRRRYAIRGVPSNLVKEHVLPVLDRIVAESSCVILIGESQQNWAEDIMLDGPWRAVAVAEYLLNYKIGGLAALPSAVDVSSELQNNMKIQAKAVPGLVRASEIQTTDGWEGTTQSQISNQSTKRCRIGGKSCIPGKVSEFCLQNAGLRWWIPSKLGPSPTGSVSDMFLIRADHSDPLKVICEVAKDVLGKSSEAFPLISSRMGRSNIVTDRFAAVSLQQWPSEKVGIKETERVNAKRKGKTMQLGFSPAALQEMQLLTQLHKLITSPFGHPNFIVPIAVAISGDADSPDATSTPKDETPDGLTGNDPIFSLFRTSEENERVAEKEKKVKCRPHLVFQPTPFVLHRFISKKRRGTEVIRNNSALLAAWFHDLLSALVHCHSNHVILRTIQSDQIVVDHSGTLKFSGLYRCTVIPQDERKTSRSALEAALSSKKKDEDDDYSNNPYVAPEILLGSPKYTKETDVWAMGCLLANLLLNKPVCVGKDRSSLLTSQYKIVGTPAEVNYEEAAEFPHYSKPTKRYRRGVEKAFEVMLKDESSLNMKAVDLIARMLHLDPSKRCTAVQALSHEYMVDYIENCNSDAFRKQYVTEWIALKESALKMKDEDKNLKRKAMLMAATKANDDGDDDLYDMNALLAQSEKKRKS